MKMFNAGITRMIGLPYGEKNYDDMLSRFHLVPERNGQTDGRTDRQICYINIAREYADALSTLIAGTNRKAYLLHASYALEDSHCQ